MRHIPPIPERTDIVASGKSRMMHIDWASWLRKLVSVVDNTYHVDFSIEEEHLTAAIAVTKFNEKPLPEGLYRISWVLRVTQPATTSSSVDVTFTWTDAGQALSFTSPSLATNLITSVQSGSILVHIDGDTDIEYSTTYASVGAMLMSYSLRITVEAV